ncbi:MAG: beta strand repeat-containing protein, partial [Sphingomonas sp.]
ARSVTVATDLVDDTSLEIAGNSVAAAATANAANTELAADPVEGPLWPSRATIQVDAVDAQGSILIAGRQAIVRSPVWAEASRSSASILAGPVTRGRIAVAANSERADARGNDHLASLTAFGNGGGIAWLQSADGSPIRASQTGVTALRAATLDGSTLSVTGNRQQASAIANSAEAVLAVTGSATPPAAMSPATRVDGDGTGLAQAASFVFQRQIAAGPIGASAGDTLPSGALLYTGETIGSQLSVGANSLGAHATGNSAASTLSVDGAAIAGPGSQAASLTVQQLDGNVRSRTAGGATVHIAGRLTGSSIEASANNVRSDATGNMADTSIDIRAAAIMTGGPRTGHVGTALAADDGTRSTTGAFAAHGDQHLGAVSIDAKAMHSVVAIDLDGPVAAARIDADANSQDAQALGNDASTRLAISAPAFASTADLLLNQSSDANVGATAGDTEEFAGVTVNPAAAIADARIGIGGNAIRTFAAGNRAANALALQSAASMDGGGHLVSRAGALDGGNGASATLALSSVQRVGGPGLAPVISSNATGRFAVIGNGDVTSSSIAIDGNLQSAGAIANTAANTLTLSGSALGDTGAALSSSQFASASVHANAAARIVAPGTAERSNVAITGNANEATASLNEVTNRLTVEREQSLSPVTAVTAPTPGGAAAEGRNLLANTQVASGRVGASASTLLAGSIGDTSSGPAGTRFTLEGNSSVAEASANRASNAIELRGATGGIASSQTSSADVTASNRTSLILDTPRPDQRFDMSTFEIGENRAVALARGNLVENSMSAELFSGAGVSAEASGDRTRVFAPAAIASSQTNYGNISAASGGGASVPLNSAGVPATASRFAITGNTVSATAYANGAVNTVAPTPGGSGSGTALASSQINYGAVDARVTGGAATFSAGGVRQSALTVSNNSITAAATGNIATNLLGVTR